MDRISKNEYYMNIAVQVSLRSTCIRRKVGAIIVKDNRILGTGYNGAPTGIPNCCDDPERCYRTANNIPSGTKLELCYAVHAEMNALFNSIKAGCDLRGSEIYVTTFPCSNCAKQIIQSGIKKIFYIDKYTNVFTLNMLKEAGIEIIPMDGSIYKTPEIEGAERYTSQDLDCVDPIIQEIYGEYDITDEGFLENRKRVFDKYNLHNKYKDEMVLVIRGFKLEYSYYSLPIGYTKINHNDIELISNKVPCFINTKFTIDQVINDMLMIQPMKRIEVEYSGCQNNKSLYSSFIPKQIVIAGLLYNHRDNKYYILKSKKGRLKGKYTMIQGHVTYEPDLKEDWCTMIKHSLIREFDEEISLRNRISEGMAVRFTHNGMLLLNDNYISKEHLGLIYDITIDENPQSICSNEPDKHDVVSMTIEELKDKRNYNQMDTWLQKVVDNL